MSSSNPQKCLNISVIGVSGPESVKGSVGVGKSLFCNRFVRPAADEFHIEHCSVLSQTDFGGSPVINNDHWLYWGDRLLNSDDNSQVMIRLVEQTEFLDDESYEPIACGSEDYCTRCCRVSLKSRDKLMYIQKEQLGIEADFPQQILSEGKFNVDGFVLCCDISRNIPSHFNQLNRIVNNLVKTKKPVVIALTKCDEIDEEAKRNVISMIMSRKDVKNIHMPPIEVSSVHDVNIEDVFHSIANLCYRNYKHRRKPLSYYEAAHYVEQRNIQMKNAYTNLLAHLMPMNSFPTHRIGWKHLLADLDRHHDFTNFVQVYGSRAAYRMYEKYTAEAREYWMTGRLRALLPQLPRVLRTVFEKIDISQLDWAIARDMIRSHALFDEYFQPIGTLGRQLEPLTPDSHPTPPRQQDSRLPPEILLLPEAKQIYEVFREEVREIRLKERLEEDFECLLSEMPEVTPGKSLEDASLFLQGLPAFENLQIPQAAEVYDRFQRQLVHRAEVDFVECLLEYAELLVAVVYNSMSTAANEAISIDDLDLIKDHLEQDRRYRCMSKIFDLRDHLIYSMTSFYRLPSTSKCPAGSRCVDAQIANCLDRFFHRRNDHAYTHLIDIVVHGEDPLVAQFISELSCFLRNEPFPCSSGSAFIRCFSDDEMDRRSPIFTDVFLIDSIKTLEALKDRKCSNQSIPSIFVVVCDPSNYDLIPVLHQQGASLAAKIGASFFGARGDNAYPSDDMASTNIASDCSSLLGRDQLMSICESICSSQLTLRKRDLRVQVSLMCGDQYSIDSLISNTFGDFEQISYFRPIVHPNLTAGGVVPIDINENESKTRVELAFCSYHSWFSPSNAYKINSTQAHVFVYYTRRVASFSHARTAICRLLDRRDLDFITPKSIFLIAIVDGEAKNDPLLIEGVELCQSIGARFLAIHGGGGQKLTEEFVDFFADIQRMIRINGKKEVEKKRNSVLVTDEDGYASLVEHVRPTSLNLSSPPFMATNTMNHNKNMKNINATTAPGATATTANNKNTMMPFQNIMARQDIDKKKKSSNSTTTRPSALKMRESRISRSGPVLLPQYRKSQPDIQIAPLATPEQIEIAPEYSLVKDALTCDEGIYETLDFESGGSNGKNMNHLDLPGSSTNLNLNINNNIQDSRRICREPFANTTNGRRYRTACVSSSPDPTARLHRTSHLQSQMQNPIANLPEVKILSPTMKSKSSTAPITATIRQSLSAESLAEIMKKEKKSKNKSNGSSRFVRKVATSFRFRKDKIEEKREEGRKSEEKVGGATASVEQIAAFREKMASRSLPQSPHLDRKTKLYTSLNNTSEKVSSAFSWLPSRSPKRTHKDKSSTCELNSSISSSNSTTSSVAQGVITSEETLETLCSSSPSAIPFYVEKCVEFIENNGGFEQEGLYRVPGNQAHLADVERKFLQTGEFDVSSVDIPVHVAATALKNFFSCLPSPAIPIEFHNEIKEATQIPDEQEQVARFHEIFSQMPVSNRNVLKYLTSHLTKVSLSQKTVMDLKNLSKVWFPTLFRPAFDSYEALSSGMAAYQLAMELIFVNSDKIL